MITNDALGEEQQRVTSNVGAAASFQVTVPLSDQVVKVSSLSSSDESSTSEDEDDRKQVAQAAGEPTSKIVTTFTDCTNVTSSVHNTHIYKDGVTINQTVYCCPASLDVLKWNISKRRIIIFIVSLLGAWSIVFVSFWLINFYAANQPNDAEAAGTTQVMSTTEQLPNSSIFTTSSISTDPPTSITIPSTSTTDSAISSSTEPENHEWRIITRAEWGAKKPNFPPNTLTRLPPLYVVFSETKTETCSTTQRCKEIVRKIQASHLSGGDRADIMHNFLIGGDGMVYEGRGWDFSPGVEDYDNEDLDKECMSVAFIGKFDYEVPTEILLQAAQTFLQFGSRIGKLEKNQKLTCLRDMTHGIRNPGDRLYDILKWWMI